MNTDSNSNMSLKLAEERTILAFIRTVAIFGTMCTLLKKETNNKSVPRLIIIIMSLILIYRLHHINNAAHINYIKILGYSLVVALFFLNI